MDSLAGTGKICGGGRSGQLVGCGGEVEVLCCQSASVVGDQGKADLVPADVDVGMVAGIFGGFADFVHKGEGCYEVLEFEGADEFAGLDFPFRNGGKTAGDVG